MLANVCYARELVRRHRMELFVVNTPVTVLRDISVQEEYSW
jgi:hypothetical protein